MDKIVGFCDKPTHRGDKTVEGKKNIERAKKIHPASVEREMESVPSSSEASVYGSDDEYRAENGCRKSRFLERIAQFAPTDVFYVDELLVPVGGGEEMHPRQHLNSLFGTNMDGSIKLPLLVFGNSIQQLALQQIDELPVVYLKHKTNLSTQEALPQWLHMVDHMFTRVAKEVLMIMREATVGGSAILQTKFNSLALLILPTKDHLIEKPLRQGITGTLNACYDRIMKQSHQVVPGPALKESVLTLYHCWKEELKPSIIRNSFVDTGVIDSMKGQSDLFDSTAPLDSESRSDGSYSDCGSSASAYDIWNLGDDDIEVLDTSSEDDLQRFSDVETESRSTHIAIEDRRSIEPAVNLPTESDTEVMLQSTKLEEMANAQVDLALDIVYQRLLHLKGVSASVFEKFFKLEHYVKQQRANGKKCVQRGP